MSATEWSYLVFGIVIVLSIIFDFGLLNKRSQKISLKQATIQTAFWVSLGLGFGFFMWYENGQVLAMEYLSAYLMEWGLSIDNIFVFILIFSYFGVDERYTNRVLLLGIMLAIVLRILFITAGIVLVERFSWLLYVFGAFLVYTGIKMFLIKEEHEFDPETNIVYRTLRKIVPFTTAESEGKFTLIKNGKRVFTTLFAVLVMLATTDLVFALDSIPAVLAITQHKLTIYTSNIFAVLGLRSLFFLLKGAVNKFKYLKEGIAIVLIFIGVKMLVEYFDIHVPIWLSLLVIVFCLTGAILFSIFISEKENRKTQANPG